MPQVLHLMNGEALARRLADGDGRLGRLLASGRPDREVADRLFLAALGRRPTDAQWRAVRDALAAPAPTARRSSATWPGRWSTPRSSCSDIDVRPILEIDGPNSPTCRTSPIDPL